MISVLIVDDEYLIRSLIRRSIPWEACGLEVVGEAGDGEEALAFIEAHRPQIALVDINMPVMNGLELAERIQELKYQIRIVFLTGYREFEYARQAVAYQAYDYLLKPLCVEEMTATLTRLAREIREKEQVHSYLKDMERQYSRGEEAMREQFLHKLVFGRQELAGAQLSAELERMHIRLEPENLVAMVVEVESKDEKWNDGLYVYAILNILCELLQGAGFTNAERFSDVDNCAIVLCNTDCVTDLNERLKGVWQDLTAAVEAYFPFVLTGGVGGPVQGYGKIGGAVRAAMEALNGRFYHPHNELFLQERSGDGEGENFQVNFDELQLSLDAEEWEEGERYIRDLFLKMRKMRVAESRFKIIALGLSAMLQIQIIRHKMSPEVLMDGEVPASQRIYEGTTSEEVEGVVLQCYQRMMEELQETRQVSKQVYGAKAYIKEHFEESDLSLGKIAAAVFLAPAYISSLFKKETGMAVTEYITLCRMKRAAELLEADTTISLTAVSERVGYTDPYYFSRCFKKYYGVTPSKFLSRQVAQEKGSADGEE